jgi:hypothetical protein
LHKNQGTQSRLQTAPSSSSELDPLEFLAQVLVVRSAIARCEHSLKNSHPHSSVQDFPFFSFFN